MALRIYLAKHFKVLVCGLAAVFLQAHTLSAESIASAVSRSVENSDARKVAITSITAQNKLLAITQSERGVTVDLFGELAVEQVDDSTRRGDPDNDDTKFGRQIALAATYPLLDGMRSLNAVYREATVLDTEIIRLSDATETIALNAVQAYIDVFRRQNIVAISQQNIDVHRRIAQQVEQMVAAGKLSEPDRFQAEDKLLAARLAHADAKAALSDAISNYQFVIGTAPRGGLTVNANVPIPGSRTVLEQNAVRNSFLLQIAQKDIDTLTYQESIDLAAWQPQLDLFLRGAFEEDVEGTSGTESTLAAGVRLNWTLYKGGSRQETIARSRDLRMRAHYRKSQVEDEVRNVARKAWSSYTAAIERRELLNTTVINNQKIVAAFKREFEAAKRPLLQVLDAERALFNLKVRRANAQSAVAFQQYRILAAQSTLSRHFGLSPFGATLNPEFEVKVKAAPRAGFDISAPPLE